MIILNIDLDNFCEFNNFELKLSYPKRIVNSTVENEFLQGYSNFRYKKVNILLGANATGKTSLGRVLVGIFNLLSRKNADALLHMMGDKKREARFLVDFVNPNQEGEREELLYRVEAVFPVKEDILLEDIRFCIGIERLKKTDSYESCVRRITREKMNCNLDDLGNFGWRFIFPDDEQRVRSRVNIPKFLEILKLVLKTLDRSIVDVVKLEEMANAYVIKLKNEEVVIQDGKLPHENILSSGTRAGVNIAELLTAISLRENGFYYCDEQFSYIHSDVEKAILSVMISLLGENQQLFFTTHNTDLLEMSLPKHAFTFLRKETEGECCIITPISASDYLKRNTDSVRMAYENDQFLVSPDVSGIYKILDLFGEGQRR